MSAGRLLLAVLVALLALAAIMLPVQDLLGQAFAWMQANRSTAWAIFVLLYVVATVCFIPGVPLTLAGGALFGVGAGTVLVSLGSTLGATAAFLIGRTLARDWISRRIAGWPRFQALDRAVASRGFLVVLLSRPTPALPFFLLNYAFGVTSVKLREYVLGSWLGMIPATLAYVYAGSVAANLAQALSGQIKLGPSAWALLGVGFAATIGVVVLVTRIARRQLDRAMAGVAPSAPSAPSAAAQGEDR